MKKLNLSKRAFDSGERLTREQMKKIMGGDVPITGIDPCKSGEHCKVVYTGTDENGPWSIDEWGFCSKEEFGSTITCYCATQHTGSGTPVNNGGRSHCWKE